MRSNEERKNKRTAAVTTIVVNALVFVLLLFVAAWRAPDPPNPEYGIELNFGLDTQGGGEVQPEEPVGTEEPQEETNEPEPSTPQEETAPPVESKPVEPEVTSKVESPVVVKESKETPKEPVKESKKEEKKTEPVKEEKPKEDAKAVYKPKQADSKTSTDKAGKEGSQGDDAGKTGDKGNPEGSLDAKALYGKQGGGDGGAPSLDLVGWDWDYIPKPDVPDNEPGGRIVFEIKVDEDGTVRSITRLESTVSLATEKACRQAIEKLTFTKKGATVPEVTTGRITFVVRSK
jgi:periplasmic protein TonB